MFQVKLLKRVESSPPGFMNKSGVTSCLVLALFFCFCLGASAQQKKEPTKGLTPKRINSVNVLPQNPQQEEEINPNARPAAPKKQNLQTAKSAAVYVVLVMPESDKSASEEINPAKRKAYLSSIESKYGSVMATTGNDGVVVIKVISKDAARSFQNEVGKSSKVYFESESTLSQRLDVLNVKITK
jgi:hypothetical protein